MSVILANHGIINTNNAPATLNFTWSSNGDTNGIFNYLQAYNSPSLFAQGGQSALPFMFFTSSEATNGTGSAWNAVTRSASSGWISTSTNGGWWTIDFTLGKYPSMSIRVNRITMQSHSSTYSISTYMGANCILYGGSDNSSTNTQIYTFSPSAGLGQWWDSGIFTNNNFYPAYKIYSPRNGVHAMGEIEVYGELKFA